jgi:hypothetical protein
VGPANLRSNVRRTRLALAMNVLKPPFPRKGYGFVLSSTHRDRGNVFTCDRRLI